MRSQVRAAKAQAEGRFEAEIAPMTVTMGVVDANNSRIGTREVLLSRDEGIRPDTTIVVMGLPYDLTETEAGKIANVIRAMATPLV